jgi:prepilin-type N-terminal cleavage/methylation domain-containing protein
VRRGFSLIELVIAIAILSILVALGSRRYLGIQARARRGEAQLALATLFDAQGAYYAGHEAYAGTFDELTYQLDGATAVGPDKIATGNYSYQLSQPWGATSYFCSATNTYPADWPDVLILAEGAP